MEGRDDTSHLQRFYDVKTYETRGSAIDEKDIERIKWLHERYGVIVFTDPDFNGERIRKIITASIPSVQHAFLNSSEAAPKSKTKGRSLGVEHASFENLQRALKSVFGTNQEAKTCDITKMDLLRLGLLMGKDSRKRREFLGETLRIGYSNGKQLLNRLELFGLQLTDIENAMTAYESEKK